MQKIQSKRGAATPRQTTFCAHWCRTICIAVALLIMPAGALAQASRLRAQGRSFVDERGGVVILRGLNVAGDAKVPPFRPIDDLRLLDPLRAWGVNAVRLLFTWEAFEPEPGQYDSSYLDYYVGLVDAAYARGAWVIVDIHQDAFSRFSIGGCGDGFPRWALPPDVAPDVPDNGEACRDWGTRMITDFEMHRSWNAFYRNERGVRDRYLAMLDALAARLAAHPGLLGFDMLNEPWGFEATEIGPLYADAANVIRARAPQAVLFVTPHALTSSGLVTTALPRPTFDNFAFSPHYYDPTIFLSSAWLGLTADPPIQALDAIAAAWNVPLVLAEFGATATTFRGLDYVDAINAALNRRFASGMQWAFVGHWDPVLKDRWNREDFSITDDQGQIRPNFRIRPFVPRIAGTPLQLDVHYLNASTAWELLIRWQHVPSRGLTRIFTPQVAFGGRLRLVTEGGVSCGWEPDGLHIACSSVSAGAKQVRVQRCLFGLGCFAPAPAP